MENEVEFLRDALDHIMRTARASRTSTRRLRWIEQRAYQALQGKYETHDLPKKGIKSGESVKRYYLNKLYQITDGQADVVF